jgi:hypothetical protein
VGKNLEKKKTKHQTPHYPFFKKMEECAGLKKFYKWGQFVKQKPHRGRFPARDGVFRFSAWGF